MRAPSCNPEYVIFRNPVPKGKIGRPGTTRKWIKRMKRKSQIKGLNPRRIEMKEILDCLTIHTEKKKVIRKEEGYDKAGNFADEEDRDDQGHQLDDLHPCFNPMDH
jgi:hypothetical protein